MHVLPMKNPMCAAFKEYGEVLDTLHLVFLEDYVTRVAYKILGIAGVLGAEAIALMN